MICDELVEVVSLSFGELLDFKVVSSSFDGFMNIKVVTKQMIIDKVDVKDTLRNNAYFYTKNLKTRFDLI